MTHPEPRCAAEPLIVTFNAGRTSFGIKNCDEAFARGTEKARVASTLLFQLIFALIGVVLDLRSLTTAWKAWRCEA